MLPEIITDDFLNGIKNKKMSHKYYEKTVVHAEDMGVHVNGDKPEKLLNIQRPNEDPQVKDYRLNIWEPVTKSSSEKVINTLNKVFNPRLFSIDFPPMTTDSLAEYLLENYPFYGSIIKFIRETYTPKDLTDPNACLIVIPNNFDIEETERFEPIPIINSSEMLVKFVDQDYYVFAEDEEVHIYTKTKIEYYRQSNKNSKKTWTLYFEYVHNFGMPPVFRLGGIVKGKYAPYYFESFMAGVLPHWNQVVNLTSDLSPQYTNHMFLEKWEIATNDCEPCSGMGHITTDIKNGDDGIEIKCNNCNGSGKVARGPYGVFTMNKDALNPDETLPMPPAGYITKPIEIVTKVEERIEKEIAKGFASINLDILAKVGENQSGIAKTIDRDPMDSFILKYGAHVFKYVLPNMILYTAAWRYMDQDIKSILPVISEPLTINILGIDQLTSEYKDASNSKVSDNYLNQLETEIINKKFVNNEESRKHNLSVIKLNPYPGKGTDDLLTLQSLGEPKWRIYKAINIVSIINKAISFKSNFVELDFNEQLAITDQIAKEDSGFISESVLIPTQGENSIISGIEERPDLEAEAKAKLKGSVGGVQGILQIQASVASGVTDRNAAIALLFEIFGFDEITAAKLLGDPKAVKQAI